MSDTLEKIYCCDGRDNNLTAAMLARGNNNWQDNPFIYLVWMMFAQRMWGGDAFVGGQGQQNVEIQSQLQAIRSQMQDNQNANLLMDGIKGNAAAINQLAQNLNCDFNTLNSCCCDLKAAIAQVSGQIGFSAERVINAVNMGDCNVIQAIKDCCCNTQKLILEQGHQNQISTMQQTRELRDGQRDLGVAMSQGFSQIGFQAQQDKCEIIRAGQDNTQRIIDTLRGHWSDEQAREIQDLKFQLSQERQNRYIASVVAGGNGSCGTTYTGCGCGCGY